MINIINKKAAEHQDVAGSWFVSLCYFCLVVTSVTYLYFCLFLCYYIYLLLIRYSLNISVPLRYLWVDLYKKWLWSWAFFLSQLKRYAQLHNHFMQFFITWMPFPHLSARIFICDTLAALANTHMHILVQKVIVKIHMLSLPSQR